jgi:hypothetical protein
LRLIKNSRLNVTDKQLATLDEAVEAIMEVDPNGNILRYPESIKGDQHLKDWRLINLIVVERAYKEIFDIAQTWHYRLEAMLDR